MMNILTLLGGVALFLFGMNVMGNSLEKISSGRLERILERLAGNPVRGVFLGMAVTAVIQSSSATTVMVVGFVTAGIMTLRQAVGVIMGANIGTTITAQILRLGDISGDNFLLTLFKPTTLAPLISVIGIVLFILPQKRSRHDIGQILLGFGVLFFGMNTMSGAAKSIDTAVFFELFDVLSNPLLGLLVGTAVTAIIQSSSASVGILQALSSTGTVPFAAAAPYIMGANIGTCATAMISCVGASRDAKRAAVVHLYFNIIGTGVFFTVYSLAQAFLDLPFMKSDASMGTIANFHTIFNVVTTLLILPFNKLLVRLAEKTVRGRHTPDAASGLVVLDERFLISPSLALDNARMVVSQMGEYAQKNLRDTIECLTRFDRDLVTQVKSREEEIDKMEDLVNAYLIKLTDRDLSATENIVLSELLHSIGDFERVGDYVMNLMESLALMQEKKLRFSESALEELKTIYAAVDEILDMTLQSYMKLDQALAARVEPLEQTIDQMDEMLKERHIERLKHGRCSVDVGTQLLETLINLERIADHCSNVALYVLRRLNPGQWTGHDYLRVLHAGTLPAYQEAFRHYEEKYVSKVKRSKPADGQLSLIEPEES